ncbi:hypothetical protein ILYODFUR_019779 [Ilyodon furcidens]|uniref:U1-type domain-containing protein n=1 Tax=Ilyodon furcidens TaxID=33524 RepID=A0ABV0TK08_9TELE
MKTPLSPSLLLESGIFAFRGMGQELMDTPTPLTLSLPVQQTPSPGQGGAYSFCEVCNLQLTSTAQAQLHYNGRSHLRRVRQRQAGEARQQAAGALHRSLPQATGFNSQSAGQTQTTGLNGVLSVSNTTAVAKRDKNSEGCAFFSHEVEDLRVPDWRLVSYTGKSLLTFSLFLMACV